MFTSALRIGALGLALALPVLTATAEENLVKPAATPAPAAGPTKGNAEGFCGDPLATAAELRQRYTTKAGLTEIDKSNEFVTYSDDPKNPSAMYNFTIETSPAHPSAVCRKLVKEGDQTVLKFQVVCEANEAACAKLNNDFNVLIARMQTEIDSRIKSGQK